ncbi:hypothetical protein SynA18461_01312 [Synechococcus sp. A18-46.1]|nr:hypothetical protein SynA18461_01312 [Synechococcus sp. A18-46.1]
MTHEEADHRLATGWHVDLEEADALCSAQRKRYLRLERERIGQLGAKTIYMVAQVYFESNAANYCITNY